MTFALTPVDPNSKRVARARRSDARNPIRGCRPSRRGRPDQPPIPSGILRRRGRRDQSLATRDVRRATVQKQCEARVTGRGL